MKIGITDCYKEDKYNQYVHWLHSVNPDVELVKLSSSDSRGDVMSDLDGLVFSGGGDVDPSLYDAADLSKRATGIDRERDDFELKLTHEALERDLPILGVCRGMQVVNVALGGSLHVDLASEGFDHHAGSPDKPVRHKIAVEPNSLLSGLAGGLEQEVNSYHHQAVDKLGQGLMPVARTSDGVIESAEWILKEGMPFLLLVQWHPERSNGTQDIFSNNLAKIFLREIYYSHANKTT